MSEYGGIFINPNGKRKFIKDMVTPSYYGYKKIDTGWSNVASNNAGSSIIFESMETPYCVFYSPNAGRDLYTIFFSIADIDGNVPKYGIVIRDSSGKIIFKNSQMTLFLESIRRIDSNSCPRNYTVEGGSGHSIYPANLALGWTIFNSRERYGCIIGTNFNYSGDDAYDLLLTVHDGNDLKLLRLNGTISANYKVDKYNTNYDIMIVNINSVVRKIGL